MSALGRQFTFTVEHKPGEVRDHGLTKIPESWHVVRNFPDGSKERMRSFDNEDVARRTAEMHNRL